MLLSFINSIASANAISPSNATMPLRCVIMSLASLSSNSNILWIISASLANITPRSCPSFTMDIISSSVESSISSPGSAPVRRTTRSAAISMDFTKGYPNTTKKAIILQNPKLHFSDFLPVIFSGAYMTNTNTKTQYIIKNKILVMPWYAAIT